MYAAYQISQLPKDAMEFVETGRSRKEKKSALVRPHLDSFLTPEGTVDATKIMDEWFTNTPHHVFISHARGDKKIALALSEWLENKLGLTSFIDSTCWGHMDNIFEMLDEKLGPLGKRHASYENARKAASHIHLMLSTSLTKMMNQCECVFFLNTSNSIKRVSVEKAAGEAVTHSPWLFHEIAMLKLLGRRKKEVHRTEMKNFSESAGSASFLDVRYPVDLSGILELGEAELEKWSAQSRMSFVEYFREGNRSRHALDKLYDIKQPYPGA
ncbi:toll/interleukin-1 receptor domain-containing protein [Verrucomicrobium sp. BvORR106]|uniref:toll/interleukin-1 receptor domain-containing protein n=1 Tax=Verrucomicrobium sp. BvORR106 TaxID=1403819 RepID=UPI00069006BF|nr:toll/interleukin-1 receptor domain-containing protein [Verrucomicrobium sp. BvORR106]